VILSVDIGTALTKGLLYDEQKGPVSKIILPTDKGKDIYTSFIETAKQIEIKSGRKIISGSSSSVFSLACTSLEGGLRVVTASTISRISGSVARLAVSHAGGNIVGEISNDDSLTFSEKVMKLVITQPDLILITGGTESETLIHILDIAKVVSTAVPMLDPTGGFPVIFSGNTSAQQDIEFLLGNISKLKIVPNLLPEEGEKDIYPVIDEIKDSFSGTNFVKGKNWDSLSQILSAPIVPTSFCLMKAIEYLPLKSNAVMIDCGSSSTDLLVVENAEAEIKPLLRRYSSVLGIGQALKNTYKYFPVENIEQWMTSSLPKDDFEQYISYKSELDFKTPEENVEKDILHSYMRQIVADLIQTNFETDVNFIDIVFLSSMIFSDEMYSKTIFSILNAVQPAGITKIVLTEEFFKNYGLISLYDFHIKSPPSLNSLALVISPVYRKKSIEQKLADVIVSTDNDTYRDVIKCGDLRVSSFDVQEGELIIIPTRNVDMGEGMGKPVYREIIPTKKGLIFDGRGRPIIYNNYKSSWFDFMEKWERDVGAK